MHRSKHTMFAMARQICLAVAIASAGLTGAASAEPFVIVTERDIAREEPPLGNVGTSTAYIYTAGVENAEIEFRRRTYHPGSAEAEHVIGQDQAYYVISGEGDIIADGIARRLTPGMSAYVFKGGTVSVRPAGAAPFSIILTWRPSSNAPADASTGTRAPVVLRDADIVRPEIPHGGIGTLTGYRYSDFAEDRAVHFRRRTLHAGAQIAEHAIPWDMGYYVLDGEGTITIDGQSHALLPGVAIYAYRNSVVRIAPNTGGQVSYLLIEPVPAAPAEPERIRVTAADIGQQETPPHGGAGLSTSFRYTDLAPGLSVELRKRTLERGAVVGTHHLGQDQIFYVLDGEIELVSPEGNVRLRRGMAAYGRRGTEMQIYQRGRAPASYLSSWALH